MMILHSPSSGSAVEGLSADEMENGISSLRTALLPLRNQLVRHPLYGAMRTIEHLRCFMEHHVYAVWDFMSLLKCLQKELTCVETPWIPRGDPLSRRLILDIVIGEEADEDGEGAYLSHFEMYHRAMKQCGADTSGIDGFVECLKGGAGVRDALQQAGTPAPARRFVETTWSFLELNKPHVVAAAFTFGREDIIPEMFRALVADLEQKFPGQLTLFQSYLERHIHLDEEEHAPLALRMTALFCGRDETRWREAEEGAIRAMQARVDFWDALAEKIATM